MRGVGWVALDTLDAGLQQRDQTVSPFFITALGHVDVVHTVTGVVMDQSWNDHEQLVAQILVCDVRKSW